MKQWQSNDKFLAERCIEGLIKYSCDLKRKQVNDLHPQLDRIGDLIDTLEAYWGLSEKKDRRKIFEKQVYDPAAFKKVKPPTAEQKIVTMNGLYRYMDEMLLAQGLDAEAEIHSIQELMKEMGTSWELDGNWIDDMCAQIDARIEIEGFPVMNMH